MAKQSQENSLENTGLILSGIVSSRKRRKFDKKGGGFRCNIELGILTKDGMVPAERWADTPQPSDTPEMGIMVSLPVILQRYNTKSGSGVRLVWGSGQDSESF